VGDLKIEPGVEDRAVELMLGEKIALGAREGIAAIARTGRPRLAIRGLAAAPRLQDVSFDLHAGEVLGVVALEGQGQDELFDVLAGFRKPTGGGFAVDGTPARFAHPSEAIAAGLTYVPGNRAEALLAQRSVRENIALPFSARPANWGPLKRRMERDRTDHAIARLQIDTRAQGEVQRLSGGNQQKVTIGRWLATGVQTLLLFDPTRGIDVRTKRQIYPLVRELAEQGAAVLFYTSELAEVPLACDRALVIFNGRVVDIIEAARADEPTLMRAAYGLTAEQGVA
jgi:ribose transport system ATP-binding protein